MRAIGAMKHLEFLSLNNVQIPDGSIKTLAGAKGLRQLYLVKTKLDDAALSDLSMLSEMQKLSLNDNEQVTNTSLKEIGKLKRLRWLSLGHTQVTDLNEIAGLDNLESLFVPGTKIKDATLDKLVNLKKLSELFLSGSGVSDAGLKSVSRIKQLQVLSLNGTRVTDEGLKSLADLKQLKKLSLLNTQVTNDGVLMLRKALPELRIEH
jgi:Leucine-rich repeat (LRR) protein